MTSHLISAAAALFLTAASCPATTSATSPAGEVNTPSGVTTSLSDSLIAFPGAEGFGRFTSGGRGGAVYHVTTLDDGMHLGTLRHAVMQEGPRTIVFDVAGTIFLNHRLHITNGDLTIAGQSAPGDGICVGGNQVFVQADNVIIRYMRFRVGNECKGEPDGFGAGDNRNFIMDHCSVSWSVDECLSVYGGEDVTVQWCISSESLRNAGHRKGAHGYGGIWGGNRATFHHNLMAHHESRTPRFGPHKNTQDREYVDMRNNVIYNWAGSGCYGGEAMKVNVVNNYYKPGPATPKDSNVGHRITAIGVRTTDYTHHGTDRPNVWDKMWHVWGQFYIDGNVMEGNPEVTADNWTDGVFSQAAIGDYDGLYTEELLPKLRLDRPLDVAHVTTQSAREAYDLVLADVGCSHRRDVIDTRIIDEVRSGTSSRFGSMSADAASRPGLIDVPADAQHPGEDSPWPKLSYTDSDLEALLDSDGDGIPDNWEKTHGLNPSDSTDGRTTTLSPEGYTNLEVYLNSLVAKN
ncbi:MAG: pectate lyase [Bacteroides sp.]|nr:pectate lyase [Bacteroides sp.]